MLTILLNKIHNQLVVKQTANAEVISIDIMAPNNAPQRIILLVVHLEISLRCFHLTSLEPFPVQMLLYLSMDKVRCTFHWADVLIIFVVG